MSDRCIYGTRGLVLKVVCVVIKSVFLYTCKKVKCHKLK